MIVIHGDDQIASRNYFIETRTKTISLGRQIIALDGGKLTLTDLLLSLQTMSLFQETPAVFIENFFSSRPGREKKLILDYLVTHQDCEIYIWESKNVSLHIKSFSSPVSRVFDLPKYVYQFLDSFSRESLAKSLQYTAPEQIFALTVGQIRKLLLFKLGKGNFPSWQSAKLARQSADFSLDILKTSYLGLLDIDYRQKTSASPFNLGFALELWVSKL